MSGHSGDTAKVRPLSRTTKARRYRPSRVRILDLRFRVRPGEESLAAWLDGSCRPVRLRPVLSPGITRLALGSSQLWARRDVARTYKWLAQGFPPASSVDGWTPPDHGRRGPPTDPPARPSEPIALA